MGFVIRINVNCNWQQTYFVQSLNRTDAKEKHLKCLNKL